MDRNAVSFITMFSRTKRVLQGNSHGVFREPGASAKRIARHATLTASAVDRQISCAVQDKANDLLAESVVFACENIGGVLPSPDQTLGVPSLIWFSLNQCSSSVSRVFCRQVLSYTSRLPTSVVVLQLLFRQVLSCSSCLPTRVVVLLLVLRQVLSCSSCLPTRVVVLQLVLRQVLSGIRRTRAVLCHRRWAQHARLQLAPHLKVFKAWIC